MKSGNRIPLTLLEACTLMARETVSLLEGFDEVPDSAIELLDALAMISTAQDLGDGGELLAWVNAEMENTKRLTETDELSPSLVKLDTPLPMPDPDMQLDAVCVLLQAAAARRPCTMEQWETMLGAVRILTEMDGLEDMVLGTTVPDGGFLTTEGLHRQLADVQTALAENQKHSDTETAEQAMT